MNSVLIIAFYRRIWSLTLSVWLAKFLYEFLEAIGSWETVEAAHLKRAFIVCVCVYYCCCCR